MPAKIVLTAEQETTLRHDFYTDLSQEEVMKLRGLSYRVVRRYWSQWFGPDLLRQRASRLKALTKLGDKNPMFGKTGDKHHNYVEVTYVQGYRCLQAPDWYLGKVDKGRVYEHILVWCSNHGQVTLPKGRVVHHIDLDKENNSPSNLMVMTISQHMKLHNALRRGDTESAETILQRSRVQENSKWPLTQTSE